MRDEQDSTRRTVLKLAGAAGLTATGAGAVSGFGAAQSSSESLTQDVKATVVNADTGNRVGKFTGTLSLNEFSLSNTGEILTSGSLDGTIKSGSATDSVSQEFSDVTTSLSSNGGCTILTLDLGPLDLEVLGLRVQLNRIQLDITGETGAGNLLGNLLCGIANLGSGELLNLSGIVEDLLGVVNDLLGSLSA
jgi:hypothetical protein